MSEQVKHTPGPWEVGMRTGHNANQVYARDGETHIEDTTICMVYGIYAHQKLDEVPENTGLANARLMAASPDLLEALDLCRIWLRECLDCEDYYWDPDQRQAAEETYADCLNAIAKTKGQR